MKVVVLILTLFLFRAAYCETGGIHGVDKRFTVGCSPKDHSVLLTYLEIARKKGSLSPRKEAELQQVVQKIPRACLSKDLQKSVAAALAWFNLPPCAPKQSNAKLTVRYSGENHDQENAAIQKKENSIRNNLISYARAGKMWLGLEDATFRPLPSGAAHLDSREIWGLAKFYHVLAGLDGPSQKSDHYAADILFLSVRAPHLKVAWDSLPKPLHDVKVEEYRKFLSPFFMQKTAKEKAQWLQKNIKPKKAEDLKVVRSLVGYLLLEYLRKFESKEGKFHYLSPEFSLLKTYAEKPLTLKQFQTSYLDVVLLWRNRVMASRALKLICEAINAGSTHVVIHLGLAHLPGVEKIVGSALKNAGFNNLSYQYYVNGFEQFEKWKSQVQRVYGEKVTKQLVETSYPGLEELRKGIPKDKLITDRGRFIR